MVCLGPIVRISPYEVHVQDPDFYDQLYSRSGRRDKYAWLKERLGNPHSLFETSNHDLHRVRRAALNPMFSRRQVQEGFQPVIREKVNKLCSKVAENGVDDSIVLLDRAYCAFSGDVITQFAFAECYNHLDSPAFKETLLEGFKATAALSHVMLYFPWLRHLMKTMPEWFILKSQPLLVFVFGMQQVSLADLV